jgi:hypothetical protein
LVGGPADGDRRRGAAGNQERQRRQRTMPYHGRNSHLAMHSKIMESGLWIFFLEAGLALALLVFIIWWTWPKKK